MQVGAENKVSENALFWFQMIHMIKRTQLNQNYIITDLCNVTLDEKTDLPI